MPLREFLAGLYLWADGHAVAIVIACLAWGLGGALLARIAKGGPSDRDGRAIASVAGIHWGFPLSELATVRTLRDVALFAIACAAGLGLLRVLYRRI